MKTYFQHDDFSTRLDFFFSSFLKKLLYLKTFSKLRYIKIICSKYIFIFYHNNSLKFAWMLYKKKITHCIKYCKIPKYNFKLQKEKKIYIHLYYIISFFDHMKCFFPKSVRLSTILRDLLKFASKLFSQRCNV